MTYEVATVNDSGNRLLHSTWLLVALGCILGGIMLGTSVAALPVLPFVAWPISMVGLVLALKVTHQFLRNTSLPRQRKRTFLVAGTVLTAGVVAAGHTMLIPMVWQATSDYAKTVVTKANLKGVGIVVRHYCDDHGDYPSSLKALVTSGDLLPMQLVSPYDPRINDIEWSRDALNYTSFDYCPGVGDHRDDSEIILAWEREAWSPLELRLFPKRGRCILFGEGTAEILGAEDFAAAQQRDRERRAELGWPVCE